jgi:uncharacterized protein (DUF1697 family)
VAPGVITAECAAAGVESGSRPHRECALRAIATAPRAHSARGLRWVRTYAARVPRFVVLLRGINVGRARRVAMADLRALLADAGYTDVRTVLNSGNAVVTGPDEPPAAHAVRIEAAITGRTGLDVRVVVLTAAQWHGIVAANPFADVAADGSRLMAHVHPEPPAEPGPVDPDPERARLVGRVLYQWCPDGLSAAPPVGFPGVLVTTRNWNTVTKLAALL